eukprot:g2790.t1
MDPKVAKAVEDYKEQANKMNALLEKKQSAITRLNENTLVKKELDLLEDETPVFKLIGSVLVKQDLDEAKANVKQRIDYIDSDLKRMDNKMAALQKEQQERGAKLVEMQRKVAEEAKKAESASA